jgi:uncharacterized protein
MGRAIVHHIKEYVISECKKPSSKYGEGPFEFHFVPMAKHAKTIAKKLGADVEVVEIAAWLHDIGSIIHGRVDHHITSAKIAEEILKKNNYPIGKIKLVKKCILNHRGSVNNKKNSIEEKIIADADAVSNFDMPPGLFQAAYYYEKLDQGAGIKSVREKLQRKYKKLCFKESKELVREKYKAAMLLLK